MTPYYDDGQCVIYHGDCREIDAWDIAGGVMVTDPPYGIAWRSSGLHSQRGKRDTSTPSIVNDEDVVARDDVLSLWGSRPAIIFGSWRQPRPNRTSHRLIWHKTGRHPGVSPHPVYPNDEEIYLVGSGWVGSPPRPTVITTHEQRALEPKRIGHPTPKPVSLMMHLLELCPPLAEIVDPFMGSGATLRAAKDMGRKAIGIEIEERYCEIAVKRLGQEVLDFGGVA